jgi:hypothetical protein
VPLSLPRHRYPSFLSKSKGHGRETHLDGKFVPTSNHMPLSVIDLTSPGKVVLDTRFTLLKDKNVLLETCRKTAKQLADFLARNPDGRVESKPLDVPFDTDAHNSLYAGNSCFVKVPVFKRKGQK